VTSPATSEEKHTSDNDDYHDHNPDRARRTRADSRRERRASRNFEGRRECVCTEEVLVVIDPDPQDAVMRLIARDIGGVGAVERVDVVFGSKGPGGVGVDLGRIDRGSVAEQIARGKVRR